MGNLTDIIEDRTVEPINLGDYTLVPEGKYKAAIMSAEIVPTKNGEGLILKCVESLFDDSYGGREIYVNFNIKNPNEEAQRIGLGQLSALSRAIGLVGIPEDSSELLEKYHTIKVVIQPGKGVNPKTGEPYKPRNEIKGFYTLEGDKPAKSAPKATVGPTTPKALDDDLPDFMK